MPYKWRGVIGFQNRIHLVHTFPVDPFDLMFELPRYVDGCQGYVGGLVAMRPRALREATRSLRFPATWTVNGIRILEARAQRPLRRDSPSNCRSQLKNVRSGPALTQRFELPKRQYSALNVQRMEPSTLCTQFTGH